VARRRHGNQIHWFFGGVPRGLPRRTWEFTELFSSGGKFFMPYRVTRNGPDVSVQGLPRLRRASSTIHTENGKAALASSLDQTRMEVGPRARMSFQGVRGAGACELGRPRNGTARQAAHRWCCGEFPTPPYRREKNGSDTFSGHPTTFVSDIFQISLPLCCCSVDSAAGGPSCGVRKTLYSRKPCRGQQDLTLRLQEPGRNMGTERAPADAATRTKARREAGPSSKRDRREIGVYAAGW